MNVQPDWIAVGRTVAAAAKVQIASVDEASNTITLAQAIVRQGGDFVWLWKDSSGQVVINGAAPDIGAFEFAGATAAAASPKPAGTPVPSSR
jgi:hypothetical protein